MTNDESFASFINFVIRHSSFVIQKTCPDLACQNKASSLASANVRLGAYCEFAVVCMNKPQPVRAS